MRRQYIRTAIEMVAMIGKTIEQASKVVVTSDGDSIGTPGYSSGGC